MPASAISATSATKGLRQGDSPVPGIATVAVADWCMAKSEDVVPMSSRDAQELLAWLVQIGESDKAVIADVLRDCQRDVDTRVFFLNLVAEAASSVARFSHA
jgi:hypothetical protein